MKKSKGLISIALIVVFIFALSTFVLAENYYLASNVNIVMQTYSNWCWAACAQMVGRAVNTSSTRTQADGAYSVLGSYSNVSASSAQLCSAAEYISYNKKDFRYNYYTWSMSSIRSEIMTNKLPLVFLAGYYDSNGNRTGGHFVVGDGVYQYSNYIRYRDPWDATTHWCLYSAFCDGSYNDRVYEETIYAR